MWVPVELTKHGKCLFFSCPPHLPPGDFIQPLLRSHGPLPGHLRDVILSVFFVSFLWLSLQSALPVFYVLGETPEQHPCQVQLALLSAGEQLSLQALLDFWASCPLTEIVPAACREHQSDSLNLCSFFFPPLLVNDDQKVRSDRQNQRQANLYWELVCL